MPKSKATYAVIKIVQNRCALFYPNKHSCQVDHDNLKRLVYKYIKVHSVSIPNLKCLSSCNRSYGLASNSYASIQDLGEVKMLSLEVGAKIHFIMLSEPNI